MTEPEWLDADDPQTMLEFLHGKATSRKLRLFACACVRRVCPLVPQEIVRASEEFADERVTSRDVGRLRKPAGVPFLHPSTFMHLSLAALLRRDFGFPDACEVAEAVARFVGWECGGGRPVQYTVHTDTVHAERKAQATLLRDIVNPHRVLPTSVASKVAGISGLASSIYDEGAFDRLPVLADALEEAGCGDAALLEHLRTPGMHVRGCWAVDLLLGKA